MPSLLRRLLVLGVPLFALTACCEITGDCRQPEDVTVVSEDILPVPTVPQNTAVWCWLASGEMVFRYFSIQNVNPGGVYQCGIVGILYTQCYFNCLNCVAGASSIYVVADMLVRYPQLVRSLVNPSSPLLVQPVISQSSLSLQQTEAEIDAGRPVFAGVSPSGFRFPGQVSEHAIVIVGYQLMSDESTRIVVNDPWPYQDFGGNNPYLAAGGRRLQPGRYSVPFNGLIQRLLWRETVWGIARLQ